jgi:RNA-directed DNA polymerase
MWDRAHQALWALALAPLADELSDKHSYGFRPYRKAWDAYDQIRAVLNRQDSAEWILDADIEGFFDNLNHQWLLDNIPMCRKTLEGWLKAGLIDSNSLKE